MNIVAIIALLSSSVLLLSQVQGSSNLSFRDQAVQAAHTALVQAEALFGGTTAALPSGVAADIDGSGNVTGYTYPASTLESASTTADHGPEYQAIYDSSAVSKTVYTTSSVIAIPAGSFLIKNVPMTVRVLSVAGAEDGDQHFTNLTAQTQLSKFPYGDDTSHGDVLVSVTFKADGLQEAFSQTKTLTAKFEISQLVLMEGANAHDIPGFPKLLPPMTVQLSQSATYTPPQTSSTSTSSVVTPIVSDEPTSID